MGAKVFDGVFNRNVSSILQCEFLVLPSFSTRRGVWDGVRRDAAVSERDEPWTGELIICSTSSPDDVRVYGVPLDSDDNLHLSDLINGQSFPLL